jgi:hypothetical protein
MVSLILSTLTQLWFVDLAQISHPFHFTELVFIPISTPTALLPSWLSVVKKKPLDCPSKLSSQSTRSLCRFTPGGL